MTHKDDELSQVRDLIAEAATMLSTVDSPQVRAATELLENALARVDKSVRQTSDGETGAADRKESHRILEAKSYSTRH